MEQGMVGEQLNASLCLRHVSMSTARHSCQRLPPLSLAAKGYLVIQSEAPIVPECDASHRTPLCAFNHRKWPDLTMGGLLTL